MTNPIIFSLNVVYVTLFYATTAVVQRVVRACGRAAGCVLPVMKCLTTLVAIVDNVYVFDGTASPSTFITNRMVANMKFVATYMTATTASSAQFSLVPRGSGTAKGRIPRKTFSINREQTVVVLTVIVSVVT